MKREAIKIYESFDQRSDEWHSVRRGVATASQFKRIIGNRGGDLTYMNELISERLTGVSKEIYTNSAMEHGIAYEEQAVANYEFMKDVDVRKVAFVSMNDYIGCSPDGLVGDDGVIEVKCPESHTHLKWVLNGGLPKEHIWQVLGSLIVTERKWADFISFDPRFNPPENLFIIRIYASEMKEEMEILRTKLTEFIVLMKENEKKFKEKRNG